MHYKTEVKKQILKGDIILFACYGLAWILLPEFTEDKRNAVVAGSLLILSVPLFLSVASMLFVRYSNEQLIQGYVSQTGLIFEKAPYKTHLNKPQ